MLVSKWITLLSAVLLLIASSGRASDDLTSLSIFGVGNSHVRNRSANDAMAWAPQMKNIGIHHYRAVATGWGQVEPEEGKWEWKDLDGQMDYLVREQFIFGGLLNGSPKWNTLDAPGTLPVNNLAGWSRYVTEVVGHCKDRVKRWEVWNEPPNGTGRDQTAADYAKIVVTAHDAAKKVDPDCLIGLAAKSVHINYLEQAIKAGAKDHFDYITLHPYEVLNGIVDNAATEAVFMNIVPAVRKMLAAQNPAKANVPIIFTELGCDVGKGADTQAHALVKAYTMGIAQGVACIHWYEARDGDSGPLGLLDAKGTHRFSCIAMGQMIAQLGPAPKYLGWVLLQRKHYAFLFEGTNGPVLITWAQKGKEETVTFDHTVRLIDPLYAQMSKLQSHQLTVAPMLILDVPEALQQSAKANRDRPLTWGGDFTNAKSISLTIGKAGGEQGLHTLSGDSTAQAVAAYGGSARAGDIPGGNLFVVDPGFLSYTTTPIEITAVVRRNEANDNAGFKLVYESTSGLKSAKGWYTIPDNKKWHTVRWQIDDPQFVNYWGYNFALVSDGNVFNKYYLQSITVTKLGE